MLIVGEGDIGKLVKLAYTFSEVSDNQQHFTENALETGLNKINHISIRSEARLLQITTITKTAKEKR